MLFRSNRHKQLVENNVTTVSDAYQASDGAHALVVLTEWDEFTKLDMQRVYLQMHRPAFVFDGRNVLNAKALSEIGFEVHGIGRSYRHSN